MTTLAEQLKQGADQARESLSEGWRELSARASGALTRFWADPTSNTPNTSPPQHEGPLPFGGWAFMAVDVFEDDEKVIVRLETPGMRREDFNVELHGNNLTVHGEKQFDRETRQGRYSVVQCAYGSFRRDVRLPAAVKPDKTTATYRDGVLRVELIKSDAARARRIEVQTPEVPSARGRPAPAGRPCRMERPQWRLATARYTRGTGLISTVTTASSRPVGAYTDFTVP